MTGNRPQQSNRGDAVVCDVGGVILVDGMKLMIQQLATRCSMSRAEIDLAYRGSGLRDRLWTGRISTRSFWLELSNSIDRDLGDPDLLDKAMIALCAPLGSAQLLNGLTDRLWLATNHRIEWLAPALTASGLHLDGDRIICSSAVGSCKPDDNFFALVDDAVRGSGRKGVTYFDDQEVNLTAALGLGWTTVLVGDDPSAAMMAALAS